MAILALALLISGILSLLVGALVWFVLLRRIRNSALRVRISWFVIVATGLGLIVPVLSFLWSQTVKQGIEGPMNSYRGIGPRLPFSVSHVTYYTSHSGTEAVFLIDERSLTRWANEQGWHVTEIQKPESVQLPHLGLANSVANGMAVHETWHPRGAGVHIVFDRDTGNCFFLYASY